MHLLLLFLLLFSDLVFQEAQDMGLVTLIEGDPLGRQPGRELPPHRQVNHDGRRLQLAGGGRTDRTIAPLEPGRKRKIWRGKPVLGGVEEVFGG